MLRIVILLLICLIAAPLFAFEYQGNLVDGERDGLWITTNKGSVLSRCHYKEGLLNGSCIKYDASELPTSIGVYLNGQQHGNWQYFKREFLNLKAPTSQMKNTGFGRSTMTTANFSLRKNFVMVSKRA